MTRKSTTPPTGGTSTRVVISGRYPLDSIRWLMDRTGASKSELVALGLSALMAKEAAKEAA